MRNTVGIMDIYIPSPFSPSSLAKTIFMRNSTHSPTKAAPMSINVPLKNEFIYLSLYNLTSIQHMRQVPGIFVVESEKKS
jgi:hypothetical protein